jgi:hypothetical protein
MNPPDHSNAHKRISHYREIQGGACQWACFTANAGMNQGFSILMELNAVDGVPSRLAFLGKKEAKTVFATDIAKGRYMKDLVCCKGFSRTERLTEIFI